MNRKRLFLSSIFLGAALIAPMAITVNAAAPQAISVRVYDRDHRDYHNWDDREEHSYVRFRQEHPRHRYSVTFSKTRRGEQREYWNWRHSHPDRD
jgi:hypothetical protein